MKNTNARKSSIRLFLLCLISAALMLFTAALCYATDGSFTAPDNGIPVVYLHIDEAQGSIEDMIHSDAHTDYCYGTLRIDVPDGFHYTDFPDTVCQSVEGLAMSIRGRGNSTWQKSEKKPFKIKLDKKTDLFGLGKNKHWVLVANAFDESLLRDRITAWLGDEMGFVFTPRGVPVDVVMTGEIYGTQYLGSYYLSENVRVGENRLEIDELTEDDVDPQIITGGYLLQNAMQVRKGSPDRFYTNRGVDWATHTPSFDTEDTASLLGSAAEAALDGEESFAVGEFGDGYQNNAQQEYIQQYIRKFEDILFEQGTAYRDLMDIESAAKYWLVNMISLNNDAYGTGSTYLYKLRDTPDAVGKLYWGPLWDFDYAWNRNLTTEGFECGHTWMKPMFYDTGAGGFVEELHKQWPVMRAALLTLTGDEGLLDRYCMETKASAEQDHLIYHPESEFDYVAEVEKLKQWITDRIAWVDENVSLLDHMVHKILLYADGELFVNAFVAETEGFDCSGYYPEKAGYTFIGWSDAAGNLVDGWLYAKEDTTLTAVFVPDDAMTHATDVAFAKSSDIIRFNSFFSVYSIKHMILPESAEDKKVFWSSSDDDIASVDGNGTVNYHRTGTVTITARVPHGTTRHFTLTITDGELPIPHTITPEAGTIRLGVGEQSPCGIRTEPSPASVSRYSYTSEDETVVAVGELGVLTAKAPGQTVVHIKAETHDADGNEVILETSVSVIVSAEKEEPGDLCPLCGKKHSDSFFGKVIAWIHSLFYCLKTKLSRLF